jgi:hypothetical protein
VVLSVGVRAGVGGYKTRAADVVKEPDLRVQGVHASKPGSWDRQHWGQGFQ